MNDAPRCYGKFPNGETPCAKCDYFDSCRYYAATAKSVDCRRHTVSFEAAQHIIADIPADCRMPGEEDDTPPQQLIPALGKFFRYLLELDEYTLGLIRELIAPSYPDGKGSVSRLAELHGCSRQAVHRKMLSIIGTHPELSALFLLATGKLSAGRKAFLRKRSVPAV
jgi:hypothetical protein